MDFKYLFPVNKRVLQYYIFVFDFIRYTSLPREFGALKLTSY